jgi:hypothetical protein
MVSSGNPFSAWTLRPETVSSSKRSAISCSESPGSTATTHAGS